MKIRIYIMLILIFLGCSDVFVPDISGEIVGLISPPNNTVSTNRQYTFSWSAIPDADAYNLQIASPSFEALIFLELDTNISSTSFTYSLPSGEYEWSVVGFNEAFDSDCCEIRTITVLENDSDNLVGQIIELQSPSNNTCSNDLAHNFQWEMLPNATQYQFQIANNNSFSNILYTQFISSNQITYTFEEEGNFFWRVRAENEFTQTFTDWATRILTIDTTPPAIPELIQPIIGDSIILSDQEPDLSWMSEGILNELEVYFSSPDNLIYSLSTSLLEIDLDTIPINLEIGDYYWKLRTMDKAKNISQDTPLQIFYIKE